MSRPPQQTTELAIQIRLSERAGIELVRRARETGQDVGAVASDLIEEAIQASTGSVKPTSATLRVARWDAWVADMWEWGNRNLPPDHEADDSRASIYEGRGE
ncbi:MAG TPA: hypothetical protein VHY37_03990 [Tepidisphaeraceae bacterium]|jgi:hypothetical protein|nr:hypothetical protein [Tepidisphaeraceae bacterium]